MKTEDFDRVKCHLQHKGIEIVEDSNLSSLGSWMNDKQIIINPSKASVYALLHEYGLVLCSLCVYCCCREHDEFKARGVAIALANEWNIDISQHFEEIKKHVGRSVCPLEINCDQSTIYDWPRSHRRNP